MRPRLFVVSGKLKGTEFALTAHETNIGREKTNLVCLNEQSVSRKHCLIKREDEERFYIHDLESFNGVFVNGTPVNTQEIEHGDQLGVGDVMMFFLIHETESQTAFQDEHLAVFQDDELNEQSTVRLARENALYLSTEDLLAKLPKFERVSRDLRILLRITSALNSISELEDLQKQLFDLILEAVPAERGAIMFADSDEIEYAAYFVWNGERANKPGIRISKTVIEECLKGPVSILCGEVRQDKTFDQAESLAAASVRSILCVPLFVFEKTLGLIYLDSSDAAHAFDEDHLQLLTGIAEIAAKPLENARRIDRLRNENQRLLDQLGENYRMIGESTPMRDVFNLIARIAPTESTVLITGESGTGKELVARSIHQTSTRKDKPFVAINCATLTDNLLESELFGHERGAFTGAITSKTGQFEIAEGGTVFLDEIGELPVHLQAKLLRVLQEREITRLGGVRPKKIDVRIIAATNRVLEESIVKGFFREDLYYRLNVISLCMPPLRERPEDISLLIRYFISKYNDKCKRNIHGISPDAKACLMKHKWPGNVRELENTIERAIILTQHETITIDDLPDTFSNGMRRKATFEKQPVDFRSAVLDAKKKIIRNALADSNGSITEAARRLAIHPNNLHRLIKEFGLRD